MGAVTGARPETDGLTVAPREQDTAAALIQRLLQDPVLRDRFRRDPAGTLREAGLGSMADQVPREPDGKLMQTLDIRESRSSLAGAMMAAAIEGFGVYEGSGHLIGHVESAQAAEPHAHAAANAASGASLADLGEDDGGDDEDDSDDSGDDGGDDSGDDGGSDDDQDAPGEGSNGEDANDDSSDGDSSNDDSSDDSSDSSDNSDSDNSDSSDSGSSDSGSSDSGDDALSQIDGPNAYPGDSASQQSVAAWMGEAAQKRGLPAELPVMASLVESGMHNLDHGDADSVGFFQMRMSVWNNGAYAGYQDKPELQLQWFLDHALKVKAQREAAGQPMDPQHYGDWIADVERPAAAYRGRYQLRLEEARRLFENSGGGSGDGELLVDATPGSSGDAGPKALEALAMARKQLGVPYKWGGSSPDTGFDCSGLVQWAYAHAGIRLPRTSEQQILAPGGTPVSRQSLRPGDLVFFRDASGDVHHVGMSLGGDKFIAAPRTGENVKIDSLDEPYYKQQFTGGRRFDKAVANGDGESERDQSEAAKIAMAALRRDAGEVRQPGTMLFQAIQRQEGAQAHDVRFMKAIERSMVKRG